MRLRARLVNLVDKVDNYEYSYDALRGFTAGWRYLILLKAIRCRWRQTGTHTELKQATFILAPF